MKYRIVNREIIDQLDESAGYIIASNHVSYLDGPLIGIAFPEKVSFFALDALWDNKLVGRILDKMQAIPVNQDRPDISTLKRIMQLLRVGENVVIFPEGERALDGKLKETGQSGIGMLVEKTGASVLPVCLFGPEKALPRNSKKLRSVPVTLVVGQPIDFSKSEEVQDLGRRERYEAIAEQTMTAIRELECPPR